ncbi:MAG: tRNA (guanosine(37)-N1)-methyltransferase TrmD [Patescibacteria group bacterium]
MIFSVITTFPESFESYLASSILKRAQKRGLIKINFYNPRDFVKDKHRTVDDKPFGGGPGMVMKAEPILKAVTAVLRNYKLQTTNYKLVLLSARGKQFTQKMARDWAKKYKNIVLISGRYEGVDERAKKILKAEEISAGPYTLTGGELPAMIVIDAVSRHTPGVLGKAESLEEKHGSYPVYTRPETIIYKGKKYRAPKVLLSGNHKKIAAWRQKHPLGGATAK